MLDFWNELEPFMQVCVAVIVVASVILVLCIYKIVQWFRRSDVKARRDRLRAERMTNAFYPLYRKIGILRVIWFCVVCTGLLAGTLLLPRTLPYGWRIVSVIGGFLMLYVINNIMVCRLWRCPSCGTQLPRKVGRSSLRPQWTDICPGCRYGQPTEP